MKCLDKTIFLFFFIIPLSALAMERPLPETYCSVRVRLLRGSQQLREETPSKNLSDDSLSDVQSQLEPLPFLRYQEMSSETQKIADRSQGVFRHTLEDGSIHTMYVSPKLLENNTVGMTVRWNSSDGEELLSTQFRLPNGENVVLGTEHLEGSSAIICIRVNCSGDNR